MQFVQRKFDLFFASRNYSLNYLRPIALLRVAGPVFYVCSYSFFIARVAKKEGRY